MKNFNWKINNWRKLLMIKLILLLMTLLSYFIMWLRLPKICYLTIYYYSLKIKSFQKLLIGKIFILALLLLMKSFRAVQKSNLEVQNVLWYWIKLYNKFGYAKKFNYFLLHTSKIFVNIFRKLFYLTQILFKNFVKF